MDYDFSKLSPNDFESLARDLIGRVIGVRFEAFSEGPDGGIDGRYVTESGSVILQVKHYHRSPFSALKTTMTKERSSIDRLQAERYVLTTSMPLKRELRRPRRLVSHRPRRVVDKHWRSRALRRKCRAHRPPP